MEPIAKESMNLWIDKKKSVCYFKFEGKVYEIPIEKYHYLETKIERKIKEYREERTRLVKRFYEEMAALGVIGVLVTSNGSDPFYGRYVQLKNYIKKLLEKNSICINRSLESYIK